jgi:D-alanine-D-alanine ligase
MLACTPNLAVLKRSLLTFNPDLAFNLVESLDGHGRLIHVVPAFLDTLGIIYSGSCTETLFLTSHKVLAKQRLSGAELPTPPWLNPLPPISGTTESTNLGIADDLQGKRPAMQWIVKSLWEHASIGLDETGDLLCNGESAAKNCMQQKASQMGGVCFAEKFVDGREFNLSLLSDKKGPQVLAPAEIVFDDYPVDKPRIVGYHAKWDIESYEFSHTPRRFEFPPGDEGLLATLSDLAVKSWHLFGISGYARVDFRVDTGGRPWILEVNANPCLSPDGGFAAAMAQSRLTLPTAVDRILQDALRKRC